MKKLYKSMLALGAAVTLSMSCALAACGDSHTEHVDADHDGICDECGETMTAQPETAEITDGRWTSVANGSTDQGVSLKLKEDGTFYYYSAWTQNIGTWKVDEGEYTYYKIDQGNTPTETDEDKTAYTGTQQLVLTAHDGATFKGVYADGRIWNMERETRQGIS